VKVVIIAGGKGTRLGRKDLPKPMVPILKKPILEYQIELLKRYGLKEIYILSGYMSDSIIKYFGDGSHWGVKIKHITENSPLGTAGSVKQLEDIINDRFMVLYGDTILDINLKKMIDFDRSKKSIATLFVHPNDHPYDSDLVEIDDDTNLILDFKSKPHDNNYNSNLVNAALYILSNEIFKYIPKNINCDFGKDIFPSLINKKLKLHAYRSGEYIKDMGTPDRLIKVENDLKSGKIKRLNNENKRRAIFLDRDGVINEEVDNLHNINDFKLLPLVCEAIKLINSSEFLAIVVTNQPVIAKGWCTEKDLKKIHNKMEYLLGNSRAFVDKIYYCPHHPDKGFKGEIEHFKIRCNCRKPEIKMIENAVDEFNIDLKNSFLIGDTTTDIQTGINANLTTFLVETGFGGNDNRYKVKPNYIAKNLFDAVKQIVDTN
jgi:D,D-heptose 1,7-bisphosphate phosphatase